MPITVCPVAPPEARPALAEAIRRAQRDDRLAPVTVIVPTNTCGVMTRRALGRDGGVVGVDMVTLGRLAELIAGPSLAGRGRRPTSDPVLDLTIEAILAERPGPYGPVAEHHSVVVALRRLHRELRLAGPAARGDLAANSRRGRDALEVSDAITSRLAQDWYDEADLFERAIELVTVPRPSRSGGPERPVSARDLVVYLPNELPRTAAEFVGALGTHAEVAVIVQITGEPAADADTLALVERLGVEPPAFADVTPGRPTRIVSTTDADEEVRAAVRAVVDAARSGVRFERIAVLWPTPRPYARLVEHHLDRADVPWNGRSGTSTAERLAPRLLLDLLDVDRRGLRRRNVFDLLADVPARDADGVRLPTASWERVSRVAGVATGDDWNTRLGALAANDTWGESARALRSYIGDLRARIGPPGARRAWADWAAWSRAEVESWLGRATIERLPEPEYRAWEALVQVLDRIAHLDHVGGPITRGRFAAVLAGELDATSPREGRVGHGVTVGPLAGAVGLDVDVTVVVGAADGLLPPRPSADALLGEADRALAGLASADARAVRLHRALLTTMATSQVVVTLPRGDLRATATLQPSRWIEAWAHDVEIVASHHAGLDQTVFPVSATEHRLRRRHAAAVAGGRFDTADDTAIIRAMATVSARRDGVLTPYDGDLSEANPPTLDEAVSPTRLETWTGCPHAYFARYLLGVEPIEEPDAAISISGRDRGSTHHDALDLFHRRVIDGVLPQPGPNGWGDDHRRALRECFDLACDQAERRGRTGRPASWAVERARMLVDLEGWLERDGEIVRARGSTVLASELRFGRPADGDESIRAALVLPGGRRLAVGGSIDRVDRAADGTLVVTDHKSGAKEKYAGLSDTDPTLGGTLFQLPAYAAAARAAFGDPDAPVLAEYGLFERGGYDRPGVRFTPAVDALVAASVASVVAGIEGGWFPHRPVQPGWQPWVECWYCEPDGLGTAERWSEWQRKQHDPRWARA